VVGGFKQLKFGLSGGCSISENVEETLVLDVLSDIIFLYSLDLF